MWTENSCVGSIPPPGPHFGQAFLAAQGFKSWRRQDVVWQDLSLRSEQHSIGLPLDDYGD